ncbi:CD48 antigen [Hoplias malabaricus]|uniref:CD48 antigen n=1 Tax=Hoplias malabaricus TaxID=27720 RepID=UPI003463396C
MFFIYLLFLTFECVMPNMESLLPIFSFRHTTRETLVKLECGFVRSSGISICFSCHKVMMQDRFLLIFCVVAYFHQALSVSNVTGYIGQSVILKSGVDPSQRLNKIAWSIYTNTTYIAVYDGSNVNFLFWRYKDRLELNTSTGDLEIKNLTIDDHLKYTVSLISDAIPQDIYIFLTVKEKLSKPNITVLSRSLVKENCIVNLMCSSSVDKISLSWTTEDGFKVPMLYTREDASSKCEMWTSFQSNRNISFTCTASDGTRNESDHRTVQCPGTETVPCRKRNHHLTITSLVLFIICLLVLILR